MQFKCIHLIFLKVQFKKYKKQVYLKQFFNHAHFLPMFGLYFSNKEQHLCTISSFSINKTETEENN